MARNVKLRAARTASTFVLGALCVLLASCSAPAVSAPAGPVAGSASSSAQVAAQSSASTCPNKVVSEMSDFHGVTARSVDVKVVQSALGVTLPVANGCAVVFPDQVDWTAYYVFWPQQDAGFASMVGAAFDTANYISGPGDMSYAGSGVEATVATYRAGQDMWANYFNVSSVVELHGQFFGSPGKTAAPRPSGPHYTWRSACMLSAHEVSAALQPLAISVGDPKPDSNDPQGCEYEQQNAASVPVDLEISVWAYDPTAPYGFASKSTWVAQSASDGNLNACASARAVKSAEGLQAICTTVGDTMVVIGATRLEGLVFRQGGYFYSVAFLGIEGDDRLTGPLTTVTTLLATRAPLAS